MAENKKTSQLPVLSPNDLVETDMVVVLDKSATTGEGSGPGGTLKQMEAGRIAPFGTTKGVVHNINLVGIDTSQQLFNWAADAINTYGPYQGQVGEDLYFRSYQTSGPQNNYTVTIIYFKLLSGRLVAGGPGNTIAPSELVLSGGPFVINPETNSDLFLEIGDAGEGPVHSYFNLGENHVAGGDPWIITTQIFFTGILSGQPTLWQFLGGPGNWGGDSGNNSGPQHFVNLSLQPPAIGFQHTKVIPLSLYGVDFNQPELGYVAQAVLLHGPFFCEPGQQMVFETKRTIGSQGNGQMIKRFFRLTKNLTVVGGMPTAPQSTPRASWFMPDGQEVIGNIEDPTIIADLGNIATGPVEDYFNLGDAGEAWDMTVKIFVRATYNGEVTLWLFQGVEGLYGGSDMGTDPDIRQAFDSDFFNLSEQPNLPPTLEINKLFYEDIPAMLAPANQAQQTEQITMCVADASADTNITFPAGETRLQAYYRYLGTTNGTMADYELISAPWAIRPPQQKIKTGNFTLAPEDNDNTISMDGGICTINPNTQTYQDAYVVAMKNITDSTDGSIVCTAATGWTYKVNDAATVTDGTFTFPAGATVTIVKFSGTNKIYIDGGAE